MSAAGHATWRRRLDTLVTYVPLALMALLAGFTWWLVHATPAPGTPPPAPVLRHDPDYFAQHFTVERFAPYGALRSWLAGDEMRHYPDVDQFVVDRIRLRSTENPGRHASTQSAPPEFRIEASADQGQSDATGSVIDLRGHAVVTRQPIAAPGDRDRMTFRGNQVQLLVGRGKVVSKDPVDIAQNGSRFTAAAMDYDHRSGELELKGRVRGTLVPQRRP